MSKLDFNLDIINNDFIKLMEYGINDIKEAINIIEGLDKPSGFSYNSYLKKIPKELSDISNECIKIKKNVENSIINYNETINKIDNLFKEKDYENS